MLICDILFKKTDIIVKLEYIYYDLSIFIMI
jgi:hypothetical protein